MRLSGYDAWVTREPDLGPEPPLPGDPGWPRCDSCGAWLRLDADRTEPWEDGFECDGKVTIYHEPYSEGLVAILGDEYEGKTYEIPYTACGEYDTAHAPHYVVMATGITLYRQCRRCGAENTESQM